MNLQTKWYKVKHIDSNGVVFHYIVNLPQLISLMFGLEEGEFLEFTSTKVGFAFDSKKD